MLGAALLLYVLVGLLLVGVPLCAKVSKSGIATTVFLWTTCYTVWYLYSPVYGGTPRILKSTDRGFDSEGVVRNWGDTVVCHPKVVHAFNSTDVERALDNTFVRMVGSSHSWSGLICSNDTVLSLNYCHIDLNEDIIHASAGCKISKVQEYLGKRGRMMYGFGTIMGQTLGGASMTSLHGIQFEMFASHITEMTAILANKTTKTITGEELRYWRSSMGLLGIVTDMKIQTFPLGSIRRRTFIEDFDKAMEYLHLPLEGLAITSSKDTFSVETFTDIQPATYQGLPQHNSWYVFGYDNIIQPTLMLLGGFNLFEGVLNSIDIIKLTTSEEDVRINMLKAWARIPGFSSGSGSEYTVPIEHCKAALQKIRDLNRLSYIYIRKINASTDILTFAPKQSCSIEPYLMYVSGYEQTYQQYMTNIEQIVLSYGGKTHWGKRYHMPYSNMIPGEFKLYRAQLDPHGKFMNDFTHKMFNGAAFKYKPLVFGARGAIWMFLFWITILSVPWSLVCGFPSMSSKRSAQIYIGFLAIVMAWVMSNIHDTEFGNNLGVNDHFEDNVLHMDKHYKYAWSIQWFLLSIILFVMTLTDHVFLFARSTVGLGAIVDGLTKLHESHGLMTIVLGATIVVNTLCFYDADKSFCQQCCPVKCQFCRDNVMHEQKKDNKAVELKF